ncbi:MAG: Gfo/Idh/MocA family oxidoreductase [Bacteroidales bacterium]|jgi:virulence factor|nr:Gfo/Idh/MocA family oxidoreductase [Bacteroidales bacterium]
MVQALIQRYKRIRKASFLKRDYTESYAFVGIGNHSLNNLYPVLQHLNVRIKTIVSHSKETAALINENFDHVSGSSDYDVVLNDPDIRGVFICANPASHFSLVKQALEHDKHVFVEKPPCLTSKDLQELIEIEKNSKGILLTGLQKRYAPMYQILKQNLRSPQTYQLKYQTGYYPEGDAITDLFIHPLDIINYLFGKAELMSAQQFKKGKGAECIFLHVKHPNNIIGSIELSTNAWWAKANEGFEITCNNAHYQSYNTNKLTATNKAGQILGIPLEKVKKPKILTQTLYEKNSFLPVQNHNELYSAGYYEEIRQFLNLCEGKKAKNLSPLTSLTDTFRLIESIKTKIHVQN